jgi:hypothetical protein
VTSTPPPLAELQQALDHHADEAKRAWWDRYLKGRARFRGVPTPDIRRESTAWWRRHRADELEPEAQLEVCLDLLRCPMTEDKLAFVNLAPSGAYAELITATAGRLVSDAERFAQTGVAWAIRELSIARPDLTETFLDRHAAAMSPEARKQARGRRR